MKVPISKSVFDENDLALIQEPLKSGWVVQGKFVKQFEDMFSSFAGATHSVAVSSCTTALHIALEALGIGAGDEVIVPSFTWIATANAVEYVGATPVFCDIDLNTFNIDVQQLPSKITARTRAIIPVHLFGLAADMDPILAFAHKHQLFVVEDAACGFGTYYKGKHVGNLGQIGCFSFHPRKAITTGEGGMLTTSDAATDSLLRTLRDHGASKSDFLRHDNKQAFLLAQYNHLGYNYRMTDIQGALGVTQMEKADNFIKSRAEKASVYNELLKDLDWLQLPQTPAYSTHAYQAYVCLFQPELPTLSTLSHLNELRNGLMVALEDKGISTRQGTHAVTLQGYYQQKYGIRNEDFPNAYMADKLTIALPLYPTMTQEEQLYVVENLKAEFAKLK